ncbi:MAG: hypothetical protein ACFFCS_13635 [Candidatus Hodarchaeota archaeon]
MFNLPIYLYIIIFGYMVAFILGYVYYYQKQVAQQGPTRRTRRSKVSLKSMLQNVADDEKKTFLEKQQQTMSLISETKKRISEQTASVAPALTEKFLGSKDQEMAMLKEGAKLLKSVGGSWEPMSEEQRQTDMEELMKAVEKLDEMEEETPVEDVDERFRDTGYGLWMDQVSGVIRKIIADNNIQKYGLLQLEKLIHFLPRPLERRDVRNALELLKESKEITGVVELSPNIVVITFTREAAKIELSEKVLLAAIANEDKMTKQKVKMLFGWDDDHLNDTIARLQSLNILHVRNDELIAEGLMTGRDRDAAKQKEDARKPPSSAKKLEVKIRGESAEEVTKSKPKTSGLFASSSPEVAKIPTPQVPAVPKVPPVSRPSPPPVSPAPQEVTKPAPPPVSPVPREVTKPAPPPVSPVPREVTKPAPPPVSPVSPPTTPVVKPTAPPVSVKPPSLPEVKPVKPTLPESKKEPKKAISTPAPKKLKPLPTVNLPKMVVPSEPMRIFKEEKPQKKKIIAEAKTPAVPKIKSAAEIDAIRKDDDMNDLLGAVAELEKESAFSSSKDDLKVFDKEGREVKTEDLIKEDAVEKTPPKADMGDDTEKFTGIILSIYEKQEILNGGLMQLKKLRDLFKKEVKEFDEDSFNSTLELIRSMGMISDILDLGKGEKLVLFKEMSLSEGELKILRMAIGKPLKQFTKSNLLEKTGIDEDEMLGLLKSLQEKGIIRLEGKDVISIPGVIQE